MSFQVSAVASSTPPKVAISRPSLTFHPTVWGDHFLLLHSDSNVDASLQHEHEELKAEMKRMLKDVTNEPLKNLDMIDTIQHLGVDYHFKDEIEIALNKLNQNFDDGNEINLRTTALMFRLLRQHGFHASTNVLEKFKDSEGNFKHQLIDDVEGLLSLYEASHLAIHGEDILDEAMTFTTSSLQSVLLTDHVKPYIRERIKHALSRPIHKCLQRLEARRFMDVYSNEDSHNATLLKFAKLDFNVLQRLHQKELKELTKWWTSLETTTKFPYARDRLVELHFWMTGVYFEPQYSLARLILTKTASLQSIMDDTYDNRATYKEADLFTEAIQRWDIGEIETLPEYMKMFYVIIIDTYNEIEQELAKEGRTFSIHYSREAMKELARVYNKEFKWQGKGYVPKIDEYLKVSSQSTGYYQIATTSLLGMGNIATKEAFEWIHTNPKIVEASAIICRLMDDIMPDELEGKRDDAPSSVECYMKQYGVKEEEAIRFLQEKIANAWKDINEELLHLNPTIPMAILERILNMARVMDVMYKESNSYTNSYLLKHLVSSLFNDPVYLIF